MKIVIDGIIGLDVLAADIREALKSADGDIDLEVSSPGGSVFEGLAVYNALRDYKREKGGVNVRIVGIAASMASYIAMIGDHIAAENNAVLMIHNPYSIAIGDYRDMDKSRVLLESLAKLLAEEYAKRTGQSIEEVRELMDEESYFFGNEIQKAGFSDETIDDEEEGAAPTGASVQAAEELRVAAMLGINPAELQKY